jgi:gluconolactonase
MLTPNLQPALGRRAFLSVGAAAASSMLAPFASAQSQSFPIGPQPTRYPSPVWKTLDDRFKKYMLGNTPLVREWTGALWAEGPAWNGVGRYVVFSDIPNNRQMRWDEVTGAVTPFRTSSNFSNGNTFDSQGRQISCEHQTARVVRYEYQGEPTILAERFDGKRLNAPNDVIVHPNGGIIFSDPGYGTTGTRGNVQSRCRRASSHDARSGRLTRLTDEIKKLNGAGWPDYRIIYVADSAPTHFPNEGQGHRVTSKRRQPPLQAA